MILLKSNDELKKVFQQLILSMGVQVEWNECFVVLYNNLILPGRVRSLFFSFDTRRLYTNVVELPVNFDEAREIPGSEMLSNILNMTLYIFGKWGLLKGLKVEKTFEQLNRMFQVILKDTGVEPEYREQDLRFYRQGKAITYEDMIQLALEQQVKKEEEPEDGEEKPEDGEEGQEETKKGGLGLWHSMKWGMRQGTFQRGVKTAEDMRHSRLGHNFYLVDYICPQCGKKLYMVLFPVGKEQRIETEEGGIFLARAYSCGACHIFYTPRPGRLLKEGDIYQLDFEDDPAAYEDYQELLGKNGTRSCNYKFNEYEADRKRQSSQPKTLAEACRNLEGKNEQELDLLLERMEDGFYPNSEVEKYRARVTSYRNRARKEARQKNLPSQEQETVEGGRKKNKAVSKGVQEPGNPKGQNEGAGAEVKKGAVQRPPAKAQEGTRAQEKEVLHEGGGEPKRPDSGERKAGALAGRPGPAKEKISTPKTIPEGTGTSALRYETQKSSGQGRPVGFPIQKEKEQTDNHYQEGAEGQTEVVSSKRQVTEKRSANLSGQTEEAGRPHLWQTDSNRLAAEPGLPLGAEDVHQPEAEERANPRRWTDPQSQIAAEIRGETGGWREEDPRLRVSGKGPAKAHTEGQDFPEKRNGDYQAEREQAQRTHGPVLPPPDERPDPEQKQEIMSIVKQADKRSRNGLWGLFQNLEGKGYREENVKPYLDKVHEKLAQIDEKAIERICPSDRELSFEEGMKAYDEISARPFLPELKLNVMEMLDKRLSDIKQEEQRQLIRKLRRNMEECMPVKSCIHFCQEEDEDADEQESGQGISKEEREIIETALRVFAWDRDKYEYPLMVCDASPRQRGKNGMVLTPDHIFYSSLLQTGTLDISRVENITAKTGLLNKGVYVKCRNMDKLKLPVNLDGNSIKDFSRVMADFVKYLQEKPPSRTIGYLARERHEKICCYRCGYIYQGGRECPKCGSKINY